MRLAKSVPDSAWESEVYKRQAMVDPALRHAVMSDIVMLKIMGVNPVIVHGGGAAITSRCV